MWPAGVAGGVQLRGCWSLEAWVWWPLLLVSVAGAWSGAAWVGWKRQVQDAQVGRGCLGLGRFAAAPLGEPSPGFLLTPLPGLGGWYRGWAALGSRAEAAGVSGSAELGICAAEQSAKVPSWPASCISA